MKYSTVALLGAGAVGAYFVAGLSPKLGDDFCLVAEGKRKERLEKEGIRINGKVFRPRVKTPEEAHGVDILLIALKYGALKENLSAIEKVVDSHTTVLSLLNGVDSEEIVGRAIGPEHMLYSFMRIVSQRDGSSVSFDPVITPGVFFGEKGEKGPSERMLAVHELLSGAGINSHMSEDIVTGIWQKFTINITRNLPQAIIGCGCGVYEDSVYIDYISSKLREEVIQVAAAQGISLKFDSNRSLGVGGAKDSRYSTLQDLDAHRHTEIDMLAGALIRLGREFDVPTPFAESVYCFVKALEEKNDGRFDY